MLDALKHELKDSVPRRSHSVLYGLLPGDHTVGAIQEAWRLINCVKDAIWISRNSLILRRESMSVLDCHRLLRNYNILDSPDIDEEED